MKCNYCSFPETKVVETRESADSTRRRRECLKCSKRFTTYERVESTQLTVIKKNNGKEKFDKEKLVSGLKKACDKTRIDEQEVDKIAGEIEQKLKSQDTTEIKSRYIGEMVLKKLKRLDKVAYLRFASVYKQLDVEELQKEVEKLV